MDDDDRFKALANETRRRTLRLVRDDAWPVGALAEELGVSQPAMSQHLAVLRDAGLVAVEVDGRRQLYRANDDGIRARNDSSTTTGRRRSIGWQKPPRPRCASGGRHREARHVRPHDSRPGRRRVEARLDRRRSQLLDVGRGRDRASSRRCDPLGARQRLGRER
ncbi:MAG: metalloregulator ArsR/SmtB family transcription factor [Acidimicrobiales bacterium]